MGARLEGGSIEPQGIRIGHCGGRFGVSAPRICGTIKKFQYRLSLCCVPVRFDVLGLAAFVR